MSFTPIRSYNRPILDSLRLSTGSQTLPATGRFQEQSTSTEWTATTHTFEGTGNRAVPRVWPPEKFQLNPAAIPDDNSFNIYYDASTAKPRDAIFRMFDDGDAEPEKLPVPRLVVKRYIPTDQMRSSKGEGQTLLVLPEMGVPKEMLEPLIELLLPQLRDAGVRVEEIWSLDMPLSGETALVNPIGYLYGNEKDITRDILLFVTAYLPLQAGQQLPERLQPRRPSWNAPQSVRRNLQVIAHSLGAQCAMLAAAHAPDLFSSLSVMDPAMIPAGRITETLAALPKDVYCTMISEKHRDREALTTALASNKRTRTWGQRQRQIFTDRGVVPDQQNGGLRLVAPPRLEWALYYDKETPTHCYDRLKDIRTPFNAIMPARPFAVPPKMFAAAVEQLPQKTRITWVDKTTHQIPYERPEECANAVASWLKDVVKNGPPAKL